MIPNGTNPFSTKTRVTNMHMYGITNTGMYIYQLETCV